jgi:hypothetical protein
MLIYVGDGAWLPGIPARDLTEAEVEEAGGAAFLLASRLYVQAGQAPVGDEVPDEWTPDVHPEEWTPDAQ